MAPKHEHTNGPTPRPRHARPSSSSVQSSYATYRAHGAKSTQSKSSESDMPDFSDLPGINAVPDVQADTKAQESVQRAAQEPSAEQCFSGGSSANRNATQNALKDIVRRPRTTSTRSSQEPKKQNPIARLANAWFDRVMGAVKDGTLTESQPEYEGGKTGRDYVWNTVGVGVWGLVFPILTIVATQICGAEQAGMLSMAFVVGTLLMYLANFGVRTYQISDTEEHHSFQEYQIQRWITCVLMVAIGAAYCAVRGYDTEMFYISMGMYFYKMVDGLADVYEGRLQQKDKLYLAGISQALRSVAALVVFCILTFITHNLIVASFGMAIAAAATFVVITFPLTLMETPSSKRIQVASIWQLTKNCAPLFIALFLYAVIDNMPKFVMEGALSYDNQLYFNALYFPAQSILIIVQLVYKPLLVRMANAWKDPAKRKRFNLIIIGIFALIIAVTLVAIGFMAWIGIPIMSFLYGIDFEQFRGLSYVMLAAGGITAAIDFLYQTITVLRRQKDVMKLYVMTFGFSLFVPILLVTFTGLPGAAMSYLIVMAILLVLLIWEYLRIRASMRTDASAATEVGTEAPSDEKSD